MQHSLLDRFRGTLMGAALGEMIGVSDQDWSYRFRAEAATDRRLLDPTQLDPPVAWGRLILDQMQHLTKRELQDRRLPLSIAHTARSPEGIALTALPIALFYHEDWDHLRGHIQHLANEASCPSIAALIVGYWITLALQGRLDPGIAIPRLLTDLNLHDDAPELATQLRQTQTLLDHYAPLTTFETALQPFQGHGQMLSPIVMALYCVLSTPTDFRLAVLRAARLPQAQVSCTLVGAISGAYNGMAGLPLSWLQQLTATSPSESPLLPLWNLSTGTDLLRQIDQFLAVWSGIQPCQLALHSLSALTVAAPRSLRQN